MAAEDQLIPNAQCADCLTDVHAFRSENGNTLLADVTPFSEADGEGRCLVVIGSQMHHRLPRSHAPADTVHDLDNLLAVCDAAHSYIHGNPAESYRNGWLVRSSSEIQT